MDKLLSYCYGAWQHMYAKYTFKSVTINLPEQFVEFLQEGGIVVSSCSKALPQRSNPTDIIVQGVDYDPDDTYSSDDEASASEDSTGASSVAKPWCELFPELYAEIESSIEQLGGQVAPKLNWSSPTDALWISTHNSLKCCNADQVVLLLKSSDRVMHDLEQLHAAATHSTIPQQQHHENTTQLRDMLSAQQYQQQQQQQASLSAEQNNPATTILAAGHTDPVPPAPQLVLRQWHDLLPDCEFRCFIHNHQLVAISQRDVSQHFPQLMGQQQQISSRIQAFHQQCIGDTFPHHQYALDVYVPVSSSKSVKILDFNSICDTTSPLLFSWDELPYTHMHTSDNATQPQQQQDNGSSQQHQQQQPQQQLGLSASRQQGAQHVHQTAVRDVELRVVCQAGVILPGNRVATGMPLDMLDLQDSFAEVMKVMQQQQLQ